MGRWTRHNFVIGCIATGDWFVQSPKKIEAICNYLPKSYNIKAVDMESAAIAQVCYNHKIPFTSIRVISDNPFAPHQQEQYNEFWKSIAHKSFKALLTIIND